ncbi:hypothetical protein [Kocuria sp. U4B]
MNFDFTFEAPIKQVSFYCLVDDVQYEDREVLALLDYELASSEREFEGATWTLSPKYGRHFHYLPAPKDGVLRLRDFVFPEAIHNARLSVVGRGSGAPDPATIVQEVYALTVDPADDGNTAIYKGVEER